MSAHPVREDDIVAVTGKVISIDATTVDILLDGIVIQVPRAAASVVTRGFHPGDVVKTTSGRGKLLQTMEPGVFLTRMEGRQGAAAYRTFEIAEIEHIEFLHGDVIHGVPTEIKVSERALLIPASLVRRTDDVDEKVYAPLRMRSEDESARIPIILGAAPSIESTQRVGRTPLRDTGALTRAVDTMANAQTRPLRTVAEHIAEVDHDHDEEHTTEKHDGDGGSVVEDDISELGTTTIVLPVGASAVLELKDNMKVED